MTGSLHGPFHEPPPRPRWRLRARLEQWLWRRRYEERRHGLDSMDVPPPTGSAETGPSEDYDG